MARTFGANVSLNNTGNIYQTGWPLTWACWANVSAFVSAQYVMYMGVDASHNILAAIADPTNGLYAAASPGGEFLVGGGGIIATNRWHHYCIAYESNTSRSAFVDGGNKGTNTVSVALGGNFVQISIGLGGTTANNAFTLADWAVWNAVLTDAEIKALSRGVSPTLIRPRSLVAFHPFEANAGYLINRASGITGFVATGSPAVANHAPVMPPWNFRQRSTRFRVIVSSVTGTGALAAQASTLVATGASSSTGTATLADQAATIASSGTSQSTATGTPAAQAAALVATGASSSTGTATLADQAAAIASSGTSQSTGTATPAAQVAALAASGTTLSTGTATLAAQSATVSGGVGFTTMRPAADSVDGGWINESGNNTNLYASIDETTPDDATTFIRSAGAPANDTCKIALQNPGGAIQTPMRLRYRYAKSGTDTIDLTVRLLEGTTVLWSTTHTNISASYVTNDVDVTPSPAISDPSNLFVEFSANKP